jgi:hypothetical protein
MKARPACASVARKPCLWAISPRSEASKYRERTLRINPQVDCAGTRLGQHALRLVNQHGATDVRGVRRQPKRRATRNVQEAARTSPLNHPLAARPCRRHRQRNRHGRSDGGWLGTGSSGPGTSAEPLALAPGADRPLEPIVLLGSQPLGACDTRGDVEELAKPNQILRQLPACREMCQRQLDPNACLGSCAKLPDGLSPDCRACYTTLVSCSGDGCHAAFQACVGFPVDSLPIPSRSPSLECVGADCQPRWPELSSAEDVSSSRAGLLPVVSQLVWRLLSVTKPRSGLTRIACLHRSSLALKRCWVYRFERQ